MASPVRDGTNAATHAGTGGTSHTISVTCSANATIVLAQQADITTSGSAFTNSMSSDTSGITWVHVGSAGISNEPSTSNTYSLLDVWLGTTASSKSGVTVTMTSSTTLDSWSLGYSSYTGCAASPQDPNASLPATATHTTTGGGVAPGIGPLSTGSTSLSTTNADDMLVLVCGTAFNSSFTLTPNIGTQRVEGGTAAGTWWAWVSISDNSVSAAQSSITFNCTPADQGWGAVAIALTADTSGGSYVASQFLMGQ